MDYVAALKLALAKEEASIKLYRDLAVKHPEIRDLFFFLVNEEEKHKLRIEDKISEITRP